MPKTVSYEEVWDPLSQGVEILLKEQKLSAEKWMELYNLVNKFCTSAPGTQQGHGARFRGGELYEGLQKLYESFMGTLCAGAEGLMGVNLLEYYKTNWLQFKVASKVVDHTFQYMNRYWLKRQREEAQQQQREVYSVQELGWKQWRTFFFDRIKSRLLQGLLDEVQRERNGEVVDRSLLKEVIASYVGMAFRITNPGEVVLDVYEQDFQHAFIEHTKQYYLLESTAFLTTNSIPDYIKKVEKRLAEEKERVTNYLNGSSDQLLTKTCEDVLIKQHTQKIQEEFPPMLTQDKQADLSRLYNLLARIDDGLDPLRKIFCEHVKEDAVAQIQQLGTDPDADDEGAAPAEGGEEGGEKKEKAKKKEKVKKDKKEKGAEGAEGEGEGKDKDKKKKKKAKDGDEGGDEGGDDDEGGAKAKKKAKVQDWMQYVDCLINIHDKYFQLVRDVFEQDKGFHSEMNKAFDYFMNEDENGLKGDRSPEFLSLFIDDKLKAGQKSTEEEIEAYVDKCLILFQRLEDKDVFEKYYKVHLASRLLENRSASSDQEKAVISKLKNECGTAFTHKLEGMFKDMQISGEVVKGFQESSAGKRLLEGKDGQSGIELEVKILTTGFWPQNQTANCNLPKEVMHCCEVFKQHYLHNHTGRRLTWQQAMGTAELKAKFGSKAHELSVTTPQMVILCLFNEQDTINFKQICALTDLQVRDVKKELTPICVGKYKVLNKTGDSKKVADSDDFSFNSEFKSKLFKVKIPVPVVKQNRKEQEETQKQINEDRKFVIEAAVVRTMKARKTMDHDSLVTEVIDQLKTRFKPEKIQVKKQIEKLIEREYLERDPNDRKRYNYLA